MQAVATIIVLISVLAGVFGIINIIHPIRRLRIKKRLIGAFIVLGSIAGCMGGGIIGVSTQPGGWSAAMKEAEAERLDSEKAQAARTPEAVANTPEKKQTAASVSGLTQSEFAGTWADVKNIMGGCDAQVGNAGEALQSGDAYAAYPVVEAAKKTCSAAHSAMRDLSIPRSAKGDVKKALEEAKEACVMSAFLKYSAMGKVLNVVDGDGRPSAVSQATTEMQDAGTGSVRCLIAFTSAGEKANLVLPEFQEAVEAAKAE